MDLPLATPELDHDALREILSLCSTTVRDEGYSPSPTETGCLVFSTPSKEVCMSTSSVTRQPRLSACSETLAPWILTARSSLLLRFSSQLQNRSMFTPFLGECFLYSVILQICLLSPNYLISFLPQQGCVGMNPNSWLGLEAL
jgi:hypothetical protein